MHGKVTLDRDFKEFIASLNANSVRYLVPDQIIQLGYPPNRIDLLSTLEGVDFEVCDANGVTVDIEGTPVRFIDLEGLRRNTKAAGRLQDLADLENLQ